MSSDKRSSERKLRTRHDYFFFLIVTNYLIKLNELFKKVFNEDNLYVVNSWMDKIKKTGNKGELDGSMDNIVLQLLELRTSSSIVIVHSAMCLESLINDYCVTKKSATYFKNYIQKLDTPSKWVIVTKIVTGKEFPTDSTAFELIKKLFALRNSLVHPKSSSINYPEDELREKKRLINSISEDMRLSLDSISEATHELFKIDPNFKYLDDYKPLWAKDSVKNKSTILSALFSSFYFK